MKTSLQSQARLAQVDKRFNEISKDKSLELEQYKSMCVVHSVGNTHLVLQELGNNYTARRFASHKIFMIKGHREIVGPSMYIAEGDQNLSKYVKAMKGDTLSLIKFLKSYGVSACDIAEALQKSLHDEKENRSAFKIQ